MTDQAKKQLLTKYFTARYIADKGILRYEIFCQAVQLAMEQVQEVQMKIARTKQPTHVGVMIIDIITLYFLEAKVVGQGVAAIAKRAMSMSQQMTKSFYRVNYLDKQFAPNIIKYMDHDELLKKLKIDIRKAGEEQGKMLASIERITTDMLQAGAKYGERKAFQSPSASQPDDTVFRKGFGNWEEAVNDKLLRPRMAGMPERANKANVAKGFPVAEGGDAPSVAIFRCALSRYTSYKQTTNSILSLVYEQVMMMILFNDEGMTSSLEADLDQIIKEDQEDQVEYMFDDIRDHMALEIEKLIWLALFFPSMSMASGRYISDQVEDAGVIKGVDPDDRLLLQNYWWARFPDPQSDAGLPFANKYLLFAHFQDVYQVLQEYGIENAIRVKP